MKAAVGLTTALLLLCTTFATNATTSDRTSAVSRLDKALDRRLSFIADRQHRIDSLKTAIDADNGKSISRKLMDIGEAYSSFANDSAIEYFNRAVASSADIREKREAELKRASLLPLAGLYEASKKMFLNIDTTGMDATERQIYLEAGRQLYSYLDAAFEDHPQYGDIYRATALDYQRQLLELLDHDSDNYRFNLAEYFFLTGQNTRAKVLLEELTDTSHDKSIIARAWHHSASIAAADNNRNEYISALANSAIADIESATLEVKSLQELGAAMYAEGDVERSYTYLSTALDNAVKCGATLRMIESSRVLPIIEQAYNRQAATWQKWLYAIMCAMGIMLIGLGVSLWLRYRQMKRLERARLRLRMANQSKDVYISRFLQLCSIYMDKLNQFCKITERKISAGKTDELYKMVKSGKFVEEQSSDFYKIFDDAFLHLYPTFVQQVNQLMKPDSQIILTEGERLNTDLRILAITRMGIDDAASIAQILNYSLNTIYAYRNRLKSRAIDRDNFEENIMKITAGI